MNAEELSIVERTLGCGAWALVLLVVPALLFAWLLARRSFPGKTLLETTVTLPLVVPPVATGLVLLRLFGRRGALGGWIERAFGTEIVFTQKAVVIAMAVMALPLFVRTARVAIESVDPRLENVARTLGASWPRVFATVTAPLAARGLVAGALLAFARAVGEFGATILVAGSIPGRTETLALAIYNRIQLGDDLAANRLLWISVILAFAATATAERLFARQGPGRGEAR